MSILLNQSSKPRPKLWAVTCASDSMFCIDFVRVTNCFYDYDYDYITIDTISIVRGESGIGADRR